jgi:hypothetical protein
MKQYFADLQTVDRFCGFTGVQVRPAEARRCPLSI